MKRSLWTWEERPEWLAGLLLLVIFIILAGLSGLAYDELVERRAREALLNDLSNLSPNASVTINGEPRQQLPVLEALRGLQHVAAHHSYPLEPLHIVISDDRKTLKLVVAQDSERPDEYWVFVPGPNHHNDPLGEYLGRIETRILRTESQGAGR